MNNIGVFLFLLFEISIISQAQLTKTTLRKVQSPPVPPIPPTPHPTPPGPPSPPPTPPGPPNPPYPSDCAGKKIALFVEPKIEDDKRLDWCLTYGW